MNQLMTVHKVFDLPIILMELTSFLLSFMCQSFQVLGAITMDEGIRSGKEPKIGDFQGTPSKIIGRLKRLSLGMPRKASPLSSQSIGMSPKATFLFIT